MAAWVHARGRYESLVCNPQETLPQTGGVAVVVCTFKRPQSLRRFLDSLKQQTVPAKECLVVDASPDDASEWQVRAWLEDGARVEAMRYYRVTGSLKGLTRQRNLALRQTQSELVAFFDDDIVLDAACIASLEGAFRLHGQSLAGAGAFIVNQMREPNWLWLWRRRLRMVGNLEPGTYQRSGMSIPWGFLSEETSLGEGDWLHGGATMWRTALVRQTGFFEGFGGYAQSEDLEFSLRIRRLGKLMTVRAARVWHLHDEGGRPDYYKLGYMAIRNRYYIHQQHLKDRAWTDVAWFAYAWALDTLMLGRVALRPGRFMATLMEIMGRTKAAWDLVAHGGEFRTTGI